VKTQLTQHSGSTSGISTYPGILASGVTLLWELWAYPAFEGVVNVSGKLSIFDVATGADALALNRVAKVNYKQEGNTMSGSTTTFLAPQVGMSNGPTDVVAADYELAIINIYVAPWSGEMD
jgi:hypothetical protein